MSKSQAVAVVARPGTGYPAEPPFHPPNPVYEMIEAALRDLGLDRARVGTPEWNPLGELVRTGGRVLIQPSLAAPTRTTPTGPSGDALLCAATPGAVLRPVVDYALRAVGAAGQVVLASAPEPGLELGAVLRGTGIDALIAHFYARGHAVEFLDLRSFRLVPRMALDGAPLGRRSLALGLLVRERLPGDPRGQQLVDLASRSRLHEVAGRGARVRTDRAHPDAPVLYHSAGRHQYLLPRTLLAADLVISLPKMQTDQTAGVALALQSALGLCGDAGNVPRYTAGTPDEDGDEYPVRPRLGARLSSLLQRLPLPGEHALIARATQCTNPSGRRSAAFDAVRAGAWEGNDTLWRAALDLNDLLLHADPDGRLTDTPQRRYLTLIDGIVGGEGDGPQALNPRRAGLLVACQDPVLADLVAARLMGMEPARIPTLAQALKRPLLGSSREAALVLSVAGTPTGGAFIPPSTWPHLLRR